MTGAGAGAAGAGRPVDPVPGPPPDAAGRTGTRPRFRGAAAALAVLAGLALALLASRSGPPFVSAPAPQSTLQTARPAPTRPNVDFDRNQDRPPPRNYADLAWIYLLVAASLLFLGVSAIPLVLPTRPRRLRLALGWGRVVPPPPRARAGPRVEQELATAVEGALARLEEGPVGDAIVACWVGLEQAAAQAGTLRRPAETSAELTERVLTEHRVTAPTLRRLAALYREARFSGHRLGDGARAEARELFERVRDELRVTS